jgi:hypothetical protein
MYMLYANNKFLVSVERVDEDGELHTVNGSIPVWKGNLIMTDQYGNQSVTTESYFYENHTPVRKMKHAQPKKKKSPFEIQQIAEGYNCLKNSIEDESYINGQMELTRNKAF